MSRVKQPARFWLLVLLVFRTVCWEPECYADDPLVVATVVDSATGKPIPQFHGLAGAPYDRVAKDSTANWQAQTIRVAKDGQFEWPRRRSYSTFRLRFEAEGYKPTITDWIHKDRGQQAITIRMETDPGIAGQVRTADGKPAADATVAIALPGRTVRLTDGKIQGADQPLPEKLSQRWRLPLIVKTDEQGHYQLPTEPTTAAGVFVVHADGYAELPFAQLAESKEIRLSRWGVIDGKIRWHDEIGANETLSVTLSRFTGYPLLEMSFEVKSDDQGAFRIDRLPPGRLQLSRVFPLGENKGSHLFPYIQVDVLADKPTKVVVGGSGRPVIGRLTGLDSWNDVTVWIAPNAPRPGNPMGAMGHMMVANSNLGPIYFRKPLPANEDGTFRLEHVLPANYQLFVSSKDKRVYQVTKLNVIYLPDGKPNPHDMGQIAVTRRDIPKPAGTQVDASKKPAAPKGLPRAVTIQGVALDSTTGHPVENYMVQAGKFDPQDPTKVTWGYSEGRSFGKGRFRTTVRWNEGWTARILADGYLPQPVLSKAPPKGRIELTIQMRPGRWVHGRVLDHDDQPVEGYSVFAVGSSGLNLAEGKAMSSFGQQEDKKAVRALTDQKGRFELRIGEATGLAVSSPKIDAWPAPLSQATKEAVIRLPEPTRMVIAYDIDGAEDVQEIFFQLLSHKMDGFDGVRVERKVKAKRGETLVLSGLTPGKYQVVRYRMLRTGNMGLGKMLDRKWISLKPGERRVLRFVRPNGIQIEGQVTGLKAAELKTVLISISPHPQPENPDSDMKDWLTLDARTTDAEGKFKTERIPPGTYRIKAEGYPPLAPDEGFTTGIRRPRYVAHTDITIPAKGTLPAIEMQLRDVQGKK